MKRAWTVRAGTRSRGWLVLALIGGFVTAAGLTASAATVGNSPAATWSVFRPCPAGKTGNCAIVYATAAANGTVYLGGLFSDLLDPATGQQIPAQNVAALDVSTGAPVSGFATHVINGPVFALAVSPDGSHLFAGGKFTRIDGSGASAQHLAAFDSATGAKTFFPAGVGGTVKAILPVPSTTNPGGGLLYIGGDFTSVHGTAVSYAAALDLQSAALDASFALTVASSYGAPEVRSLATGPSAAGTPRIYLGGHFNTVDGAAHQSVAALDPATGAADPTFTPVLDVAGGGTDTLQAIDAIAPVGSAGGTQAPGVVLAQAGHANRAYRFDLSGNRIWTATTDGDVQAAVVDGSSVYLGGHFTCVANCYNGSPDPVNRLHLAAFSYASANGDAAGAAVVDSTWAPAMAPAWAPYFYGVWSLTMMNGSLVSGGVFEWVVSGTTRYNQPKIAVFPPAALPAP